jgi:hypothetical protein
MLPLQVNDSQYEHKERKNQMNNAIQEVGAVLEKFQEGYTHRDLTKLDEFIHLFEQSAEVEMIGIGAAQRGSYEWFEGIDSIKEIIQSDWENWGDVQIDVSGAKIRVHADVAWVSTTATLAKTDLSEVLPFFVEMIKEKLEDESKPPEERMTDIALFSVNRLSDMQREVGHQWPQVITMVLTKNQPGWQIAALHWSIPAA